MNKAIYRIIGDGAKRVNNTALLIENGGITVEFDNLPEEQACVLELNMQESGGIATTRIISIKGNKASIERRDIKVGVMQLKLHFTDATGKIVGVIVCEPICVHSIFKQVDEPLLGYTELGNILERIAQTEQELATVRKKYEEAIAKLDDYQRATTAALEDIRGAYKLNLFGGKKQ